MKLLYLPIARSGSGKTFFSTRIESENLVRINPDSIRKELFGDEGEQKDGWKVFKIAEDRCVRNLSQGKSVIVDALNRTKKSRENFLAIAENCGAKVVSIMFPKVTLEQSLKQNQMRDKVVPEDVIRKQEISAPEKDEIRFMAEILEFNENGISFDFLVDDCVINSYYNYGFEQFNFLIEENVGRYE